MNVRIAAFVACRLLALYVVLNYATAALVLLIRAIILHSVGDQWFYVIAEAVTLAVYGALGLFFWLGAGWSADRVVKPLGGLEIAGPGINGWKALAIASVGTLCLFAAARMVGRGVEAAIHDRAKHNTPDVLPFLQGQSPTLEQILPSLVAGALIFVVVGILLIACSGSIVKALNALLMWGNRPLIDRHE